MGHKKNVDTTMFRHAVWNYIHRIYGIIHDDYNYVEMEDLLDSGFRSYVETVCFSPQKITQNSYDEIMRAFRHSEKVGHFVLLCTNMFKFCIGAPNALWHYYIFMFFHYLQYGICCILIALP